MASIGTPFTKTATKVLLCGSGELGKEVIACDAYDNAPAMQVADRAHVFSEVSPRPHDTGMVTMISQDLSQFALHARAILGLPIPNIHNHGPSASCAHVVEGHSEEVSFGKPKVAGKRRMAVGLGRSSDIEQARAKARGVISALETEL